MAVAPDPPPAGLAAPRWSAAEKAFWLLPALAFFFLPDRRLLLAQIFVQALFALSMDLLLGYAGIVSLGQAAFFGTGAYLAGLAARHGWTEPLSALAAASLLCAALGWAVSALLVRASDLGRLMITLAVGLLLWEAANRAAFLTGGIDGLSDMQPTRLLGRFTFGLDGTTAAVYSFAVLALVFLLLRRLVLSPFGLALRGIRENPGRMEAIGASVRSRLAAAFALSAGLAGLAGAVLAQTTQFVGIDTLSLQRSAEVLIMVVLGGVGRLHGALVGAAVFIVAQDVLAGLSPEYWQFWLGAALVVLVLAGRGGLLGAVDRLRAALARRTRSPTRGPTW
jgi:branched-chain amino acid transport system permease protein